MTRCLERTCCDLWCGLVWASSGGLPVGAESGDRPSSQALSILFGMEDLTMRAPRLVRSRESPVCQPHDSGDKPRAANKATASPMACGRDRFVQALLVEPIRAAVLRQGETERERQRERERKKKRERQREGEIERRKSLCSPSVNKSRSHLQVPHAFRSSTFSRRRRWHWAVRLATSDSYLKDRCTHEACFQLETP